MDRFKEAEYDLGESCSVEDDSNEQRVWREGDEAPGEILETEEDRARS